MHHACTLHLGAALFESTFINPAGATAKAETCSERVFDPSGRLGLRVRGNAVSVGVEGGREGAGFKRVF